MLRHLFQEDLYYVDSYNYNMSSHFLAEPNVM